MEKDSNLSVETHLKLTAIYTVVCVVCAFFLGKGSSSIVKFSRVFIIKILLRVSSSKFSLTKVIFKKI